MKIITATLALAITAVAITNAAAASYRLAPNASWKERQRYESDHAQVHLYHAGSAAVRDSRASIAVEAERRPHTHSTHPSHDVHIGARYVGSDPDPAIRASIRQEGHLQHR